MSVPILMQCMPIIWDLSLAKVSFSVSFIPIADFKSHAPVEYVCSLVVALPLMKVKIAETLALLRMSTEIKQQTYQQK